MKYWSKPVTKNHAKCNRVTLHMDGAWSANRATPIKTLWSRVKARLHDFRRCLKPPLPESEGLDEKAVDGTSHQSRVELVTSCHDSCVVCFGCKSMLKLIKVLVCFSIGLQSMEHFLNNERRNNHGKKKERSRSGSS